MAYRTNKRTRGIFKTDNESFAGNLSNIVEGKDTIRAQAWLGTSITTVRTFLDSSGYKLEENPDGSETWKRIIGGNVVDQLVIRYDINGNIADVEYKNYHRGPTAPREVKQDTRTESQKITRLLRKYPATGAEEKTVFFTSKKGKSSKPESDEGDEESEGGDEGFTTSGDSSILEEDGEGLDIVGDADDTSDILGSEDEKEEIF